MIYAIGLLAGLIPRLFRTRRKLLLENLALRQQLVALNSRFPRPRLTVFDKIFWVLARSLWSEWKQAQVLDILSQSFVKLPAARTNGREL